MTFKDIGREFDKKDEIREESFDKLIKESLLAAEDGMRMYKQMKEERKKSKGWFNVFGFGLSIAMILSIIALIKYIFFR